MVIMFWVISKFVGSARQAREIQRAGGTFDTILAKVSGIRKTQRGEQKVIKKFTTATPNARTPTGKAAKTVEKAAAADTIVEKQTTEVVETTDAIIADLANTTKTIRQEVKEKLITEESGEKEVAEIEALGKRLQFLDKYSDINKATASYLHEYFQSLASHLKKQLDFEKENTQHYHTFVKHLQQSTQDLVPILNYARSALRTLLRKENREKRAFKNELRSLNRAVNAKNKELLKEKAKGKNADPQLIFQLERERTLLAKNAAELEIIKTQLVKAHELIDLEINKLKQVLDDARKIAREQKRTAKKIANKRQSLDKRLKNLQTRHNKIQQVIDRFKDASQVHGLVLAMSASIKEYFDFYVQEIKDDVTFLTIVKKVLLDNILLERKMRAFPQLLQSVTESEKAIDEGTAAILTIVSIMYTEDVTGSLREQAAAMRSASKVLDNEERIDQALGALTEQIEQESLAIMRDLDKLLEREKKRIIENETLHQEEAQHLGEAMATMINRKVALDETYLKQAVDFGDKLKERNTQAAAAYERARP